MVARETKRRVWQLYGEGEGEGEGEWQETVEGGQGDHSMGPLRSLDDSYAQKFVCFLPQCP